MPGTCTMSAWHRPEPKAYSNTSKLKNLYGLCFLETLQTALPLLAPSTGESKSRAPIKRWHPDPALSEAGNKQHTDHDEYLCYNCLFALITINANCYHPDPLEDPKNGRPPKMNPLLLTGETRGLLGGSILRIL